MSASRAAAGSFYYHTSTSRHPPPPGGDGIMICRCGRSRCARSLPFRGCSRLAGWWRPRLNTRGGTKVQRPLRKHAAGATSGGWARDRWETCGRQHSMQKLASFRGWLVGVQPRFDMLARSTADQIHDQRLGWRGAPRLEACDNASSAPAPLHEGGEWAGGVAHNQAPATGAPSTQLWDKGWRDDCRHMRASWLCTVQYTTRAWLFGCGPEPDEGLAEWCAARFQQMVRTQRRTVQLAWREGVRVI